MKLRIRHKLFLTILLTSSLAACGLFFFLQWSFDRGFLNYVNNQEVEKLGELAEALTDYYSEEDGWEELRGDHQLWRSIQRNLFFRDIRRLTQTRPQEGPFKPGQPPPMDPVRFGMKVVLLDAEKNKVIGGPPLRGGPPVRGAELTLIPIDKEKKTVGYLGLIQVTKLSDTGDLLFVKQQTQTFAVVTLMMLGISILLTFPVTSHLLKPIKYLTEGTRKLIGGKFTSRIPVTSEDELGELSQHFNMLAMTLEENEKARQRWIADISHELRTPLAVLRGELEALLDGVRKTGPQTLEPLHGEILHMQRLVNDLYELSMSDIGALTYKKLMVNPIGILTGAVELFEKRYEEKGLALKIDLPDVPGCSLLADPDRLQQLFTNLLENSLRYTDPPGILEIKIEASKETITVWFQDSGPGVSDEQLPLIFDRLYRADRSRNRTNSGAGLGLAICVNIVKAHQGEISSYHSPHGGLSIKIELAVTS